MITARELHAACTVVFHREEQFADMSEHDQQMFERTARNLNEMPIRGVITGQHLHAAFAQDNREAASWERAKDQFGRLYNRVAEVLMLHVEHSSEITVRG